MGPFEERIVHRRNAVADLQVSVGSSRRIHLGNRELSLVIPGHLALQGWSLGQVQRGKVLDI